MAVLFLDPLALLLLLGLLVYVGVVWSGRFRRWFGRPERWTLLAWPLPVLVLVVPAIVAVLRAGLAGIGLHTAANGTVDAAVYAAATMVPSVGLLLLPPRWLLPWWARRRIVSPPADGPADLPGVPRHALAAVNGSPGHGSLARWIWRVDGVPGFVWRDGDLLRFRADPSRDDHAAFDDEAIAGLRFAPGDTLWLEPPRGGLWARHHADVDLAAVDGWQLRATRRWRRDGLLVVEVVGRQPLSLWVADAKALASVLRAPEPVA